MKINKRRTALPWAPKKQPQPFQRSFENSNQKDYNSKLWRDTSKQNLMDNPLCAVCQADGRTKEAALTDHLIPINSGGSFLDSRNHMSMCHGHHNRKSGMERHRSPLIEATGEENELIPVKRSDIFNVLLG